MTTWPGIALQSRWMFWIEYMEFKHSVKKDYYFLFHKNKCKNSIYFIRKQHSLVTNSYSVPGTYTSVHPFTQSIRPSIYPSFHLPILPSIRPSIHPSIHPTIYPSFHSSVHLSILPFFHHATIRELIIVRKTNFTAVVTKMLKLIEPVSDWFRIDFNHTRSETWQVIRRNFWWKCW